MTAIKAFLKENFWLIFAVVYLISPIDFIPDILPVLGFGDDLLLLIATLVYRFILYRSSSKNSIGAKVSKEGKIVK